MIRLLDHNQHLPTGEEWPYKDAGELYSEAEASKLFKALLANARLGSPIMGISGGVPVMLKTWGQNLNFCMSSWFMTGPHLEEMKQMHANDAPTSSIDTYFESVGGVLTHRIGCLKIDGARPEEMQLAAHMEGDMYDSRVELVGGRASKKGDAEHIAQVISSGASGAEAEVAAAQTMLDAASNGEWSSTIPPPNQPTNQIMNQSTSIQSTSR